MHGYDGDDRCFSRTLSFLQTLETGSSLVDGRGDDVVVDVALPALVVLDDVDILHGLVGR